MAQSAKLVDITFVARRSLGQPVPERVWTVAMRPSAMESDSSPSAKVCESVEKGCKPAIGKYSLSSDWMESESLEVGR